MSGGKLSLFDFSARIRYGRRSRRREIKIESENFFSTQLRPIKLLLFSNWKCKLSELVISHPTMDDDRNNFIKKSNLSQFPHARADCRRCDERKEKVFKWKLTEVIAVVDTMACEWVERGRDWNHWISQLCLVAAFSLSHNIVVYLEYWKSNSIIQNIGSTHANVDSFSVDVIVRERESEKKSRMNALNKIYIPTSHRWYFFR